MMITFTSRLRDHQCRGSAKSPPRDDKTSTKEQRSEQAPSGGSLSMDVIVAPLHGWRSFLGSRAAMTTICKSLEATFLGPWPHSPRSVVRPQSTLMTGRI
ncbi:hypothetical protein CDEST_07899 [Colletotrichum destructivum]|uniref:Uncharacterized protein n=1 Tax=Colletotrichum destructivum TaxID=34406 RepID=A0AAX4IHE8_9PEZI|nr:hypothetical protein CDEST_07899 [Colletotrichum destructivum]